MSPEETPQRVIVLQADKSAPAGWEGAVLLCDTQTWKRLGGGGKRDVWKVPELTNATYADRVRRLLAYTVLRMERFRGRTVHVEVHATRGPLPKEVERAVKHVDLAADREAIDGGVRFIFRVGGQGDGWVTASESMQKIRAQVEALAALSTPVLIVGPTGSGKEEVARRLHRHSGRAGIFTTLNGALLDRELAESRLFGHVKGAFTGADNDQAGRVEEAMEGTFFLDEVFHVPASVQPSLLRAFNDAHEGIVRLRRLGGRDLETIEVRLVTAAQQHPLDLDQSPVRDDLYHRIAGEVIEIPPLSERPEDIDALVRHFGPDLEWHPSGRDLLHQHPWPGNARELRVVVDRLRRRVVDRQVKREDLRDCIDRPEATLRPVVHAPSLDVSLAREELRIREAALALEGSVKAAAGRLGLTAAHWARGMSRLRKTLAEDPA